MFKRIFLSLICPALLFAAVACEADKPENPQNTEPPVTTEQTTGETTEAPDPYNWLNVATFNIWHCGDLTNNEVITPSNISDFIYDYNVDICGLQEVGVNWNKGGNYNQPEYIAHKLTQKTGQTYYSAFAAGLEEYHHAGAYYGNALISKYPIKSYRAVKMTMREAQVEDGYEHRVMLIAELDVDGKPLTVIVTHFDLKQDARTASVNMLKEELKSIATPVIFMGDLNDTPNSITISKLSNLLKQAGTGKLTAPTFPSTDPSKKIDYIFTSKDVVSKDIRVATDVKCSDHLPVIVSIGWPK